MYVDHTIHICYYFSVLKYNQVTLLISVQFCSEQNRQRGITEIYNSYLKYKNSDVITDLDKSDRVVLMKISVFSMQFSFFFFFFLAWIAMVHRLRYISTNYIARRLYSVCLLRDIFLLIQPSLFVYFVNVNVLVDKRVRKKTKIIIHEGSTMINIVPLFKLWIA